MIGRATSGEIRTALRSSRPRGAPGPTRARAAAWLAVAVLAAACGDQQTLLCGVSTPCILDEACSLETENGYTISCRCATGGWECHRDCPAESSDPTAPCYGFDCRDFDGCACGCGDTGLWVCSDDRGLPCVPAPAR